MKKKTTERTEKETSKQKSKKAEAPRRVVEPDQDEFAERYEERVPLLKSGSALEAQCLDVSDMVIGHVLFEVLNTGGCKSTTTLEVKYLAQKGTAPAKSKLAKRGSGVLVCTYAEKGVAEKPQLP